MVEFTRAQRASRVTLTGLALNLILTIIKYICGFLGNSAAMIADATHSFSDLATDVIVFLGFRVVEKPADSTHQYGHGKVETLLSAICGVFLMLAGLSILWTGSRNVLSFLKGQPVLKPGNIALLAAFISVVSKELLYRYTIEEGQKLNSPAIVAKAWDHRSDAFSSLGTLVGIGGAILLGEEWRVLDPVAAIIVSGLVLKVSLGILGESFNELLEASLDRNMRDKILATIRSFPDVRNVHQFRTRKIGPYFAVEAHIMVPRDLSLVHAHRISSEIERKIHSIFGVETLVTLHVEPLPGKGEEHVDP